MGLCKVQALLKLQLKYPSSGGLMFSISLLIFNQYAAQKDVDNLWLANQQLEKDLEVKEQD